MPIINTPSVPAGAPGLTVQDLLDLDFLRVDVNGFIINGAGANISGSPSVADQTALLALDPATYARYVINIASGMNNAYFASNASAFGPVNGQYIQQRQTVPGDIFVFPDNVTWTVSDSGVPLTQGGGNRVRLHSSAVHNITELNAEGSYLHLLSGGTGWTAGTSHQIAPGSGYIGTSDLDIDTKWTAGMGVPVFAKASTTEALSALPLGTITLPALRANSEAILEWTIGWSDDAGTGQRRGKFILDATEFQNNNATTANTNTTGYRHGFRNQNDASAQRGICGLGGNGYGVGTNAIVTGTVATGTAGKIITLKAVSSVVGITARIEGYDLLIRG